MCSALVRTVRRRNGRSSLACRNPLTTRTTCAHVSGDPAGAIRRRKWKAAHCLHIRRRHSTWTLIFLAFVIASDRNPVASLLQEAGATARPRSVSVCPAKRFRASRKVLGGGCIGESFGSKRYWVLIIKRTPPPPHNIKPIMKPRFFGE